QKLVIAPSGERVAGVGADSVIRIWRISNERSSGEPEIVFELVEDATGDRGPEAGTSQNRADAPPLPVLAWSPDETQIAAARGRAVQVWTLNLPKRRTLLRGHVADVTALAFDPVRSNLATSGNDGTVRIWDLGAEEPRPRPLVLRTEASIHSLDYDADGKH